MLAAAPLSSFAGVMDPSGGVNVPVKTALTLGAKLDTATPLSLPTFPVVPANVTILSVTEAAGPVKSPAPAPSAPLSPARSNISQMPFET